MKNLLPRILDHDLGKTPTNAADTPAESFAKAKNHYFNLYSKDLVSFKIYTN